MKVVEKTLDETLTLKRKMGLITLSFTLFSTLSFLSTYSFLFGYYFGGEVNNSFSNFELFRRFVPFHINTMTFTYLMLSLSLTLIIYAMKFLKQKGFMFKTLAFICLIIFHLLITAFFSQDINIKNFLYFAAIWIIPLLIAVMVLFLVQGTRVPFKTFSGALFGLSMLIGTILFFNSSISEEWKILLLNIAIFGFGAMFSKLAYNKFYNFIFIFPYIFLVLILIIRIFFMENFKEQSDVVKLILSILIPFIVSTLISFFLRKKLIELNLTENNTMEGNSLNRLILDVVLVFINPKSHKGALVFIITMLLGAYIMTPRVSIATAKIIRSFTPHSEFQFDLISIKDFNDQTKTIKGIIVAEQDGVIYLSNERWELEQLKVDSYLVKRDN